MTDRKFYRTTFTIVILSEEPISDMELENLHYEVTDGHCCLRSMTSKETMLDGKQAARALFAAGSEPEFFQLNTSGNDTE
jgi:hypothetical protein